MRVHPRGCGEAADALALPPAPLGPSPRVRGSPTVVPPLDMSQGSIPAGAGKPKPFCSSPPSIRVHPRGCGEARSAFDSATHSGGPSPRVRGSLRRDFIFVVSPRSIPAGAGKPAVLRARRLLHRVHPRGCGEAPEGRAPAVGRGGPSPRVRGSHSTRLRFASILGSIPAGAGKPMTDRITADGWRVHPRGCGEADRLDVALPRLQGPSPRVRGSLAGETERCIRSGSIPAGAGKPSPCRQGSLWFRVHPRWSGNACKILKRKGLLSLELRDPTPDPTIGWCRECGSACRLAFVPAGTESLQPIRSSLSPVVRPRTVTPFTRRCASFRSAERALGRYWSCSTQTLMCLVFPGTCV